MSASCPLLGFTVMLHEQPALAGDAAHALPEELADFAEREGLSLEGWMKVGSHWQFVVTREGSQTTEADRDIVREWAHMHISVSSIEIGPLVDLSDT